MPLNKTLYDALVAHYGRDNVIIVSEGERMIKRYVSRPYARPRRGEQGGFEHRRRIQLEVDHSGEEYKINCPFCTDVRKRCLVSHLFGVWDEETQDNNLFLVQCFNEQCFNDYDNRREFYDAMYNTFGDSRKVTLASVEEGDDPQFLSEAEPPGPIISLAKLAKRNPKHPALVYLRKRRGFDPVELSKLYGVGYCPESRFPLAEDRIYIPIRDEEKLIGWQMRFIGEPPKDGPPKYWTMPGFKKSLCGYGFAEALGFETVVLVEGPADRWRVGQMAIALLGKTLRRSMAMTLVRQMRPRARLVIALDPKQDPVEAKRRKKHHIERVYDVLNTTGNIIAPDDIIRLWLPDDSDPGSLSTGDFWKLASRAARRQGITDLWTPDRALV